MGRTSVNQVFTQADWNKYNKYAAEIKGYLDVSGLPENTKTHIFNVLATREQMRLATNRIASEQNVLIDQMKEINKKYKVEPNDAKARKLAEEHRKLEVKVQALAEERAYFLGKYNSLASEAKKCIDQYNAAVTKNKIQTDPKKKIAPSYIKPVASKNRA